MKIESVLEDLPLLRTNVSMLYKRSLKILMRSIGERSFD